MISVHELLEHLKQEQLLPAALLANLRKQVAEAKTQVAATTVLKRLVEKGHLTAAQSQRLLALPATEKDKPAGGKGTSLPVQPLPEAQAEKATAYGFASEPADAKPAPKAVLPVSEKLAEVRPVGDLPPAKPGDVRPVPTDDVDEYAIAETLEERIARQKAEQESRAREERGPSQAVKLAEATPVKPLGKSGGAKKVKEAPAFNLTLGDLKLKIKFTVPRTAPQWLRLALPAALVMALVGAGMWYYLQPPPPDGGPALIIADTAYQANDFRDAVEKYDAFLQDFYWHEAADRCRVRRGLARLRLAQESDGAVPLDTVKAALADMAPRAEFVTVQPEMAKLLPPIAEKYCDLARRAPEAGLLRQAREAVILVQRFVAPAQRNPVQEAQWELTLGFAQRELERRADLTQTLAKIKDAAQQGHWAEAYAARTTLLKSYGDLLDHLPLREALQTLAAAEQKACEWTEKKQPAAAPESGTPLLATVGCATRQLTQPAADNEGRVVPVHAEGVASALDAASGQLLWRRYTGFPPHGHNAQLTPAPVAWQPGRDWLVVDRAGSALLRVEARSGRVRWRQTLEERVETAPAVLGTRVYATTPSGKLLTLDLDSGALLGYVQMPQPLPVGPVVDPKRELIFLVGQQAHLYVLHADEHECRQVFDLKHEVGSIAAAPVLVEGWLLLATNDRLHDATLRVLAIRDDRTTPLRFVQGLSLSDAVYASPAVAGAKVAVTTAAGRRHVYDVSSQDPNKPLVERQVDAGEADLQLPLLLGAVTYRARRRAGFSGALVSATAKDQILWQTQLGTPWAAVPQLTESALTLVTAAGGVHKLDLAAVKGETIAEQIVAPMVDEMPAPLTGLAVLDAGRLAFGGDGSRQVLVYEPQSSAGSAFRRVPLPDALGGPPTSFAGGLLIPGRSGQVALVDPRDGHKLAEPFQPPVSGAAEYHWSAPCVMETERIALSDGREKLFLLALRREPHAHLEALATTPQPVAVRSRLAALGEALFGVDAAATLIAFRLPQLAPGETWPLGSRCAWGPAAAGPNVLVATTAGKLKAFSAQRQPLWEIDLPYGPPVGAPAVQAGACLLATPSGTLWKIDLASGKELGHLDLGRPLGAGPLLVGTRLFVGGHDGTLYEVKPF